MQVLDLERVSTFWNYIVMICRDLNGPQPCFDGRLCRLVERTLLLLLNAVPNNYKWAFAADPLSSAAPYYIYRVENYIRGHAHEPISPDDLVSVGGVSARSIYNGFRRFRSTTPMGYLKAVRLDMARDALIRGPEARPAPRMWPPRPATPTSASSRATTRHGSAKLTIANLADA